MYDNPFENEIDAFDLPDTSFEEKVTKIKALAIDIRFNWNDPRGRCSLIVELCDKLLIV